jgi:hypothetical protein
LKQDPKVWYELINTYIIEYGLKGSESNHNLYFSNELEKCVILILYIDDLLAIRNHIVEIKRLKRKLENVFKMLV